jgi:hypothetical protein
MEFGNEERDSCGPEITSIISPRTAVQAAIVGKMREQARN